MARKYSPPISPISRGDDPMVELGFSSPPPPWELAMISPVEKKEKKKEAVGLEKGIRVRFSYLYL